MLDRLAGFWLRRVAFFIGLDPADEIIESNLRMYLGLSKSSRQHFQDLLLSHDLKGGRRRVMGLIENL